MCLVLFWKGVGLFLACYRLFVVPVLQNCVSAPPPTADLLGTERNLIVVSAQQLTV